MCNNFVKHAYDFKMGFLNFCVETKVGYMLNHQCFIAQ